MEISAPISQNPFPLPFDPNVFPKLGVKLSYLNKFFDYCGGRQCLEGLTTTEVNVQFVMPMTQESQSSVCDLLVYRKEKDKEEHAAVGIANVFISHAWKFKFLDVVDALVAHFNDKDSENNVILWFDLFSNNQHKAVDLTFDYWSNTFKSAIKAFGHTVMVLSPWNDPVPLTRAWCLWELYCTVDTKSKFEIAMTQPSRNQFIEDVLVNPQGEINKMLGTINVERSECFKESDRESIFEAVRLTVGFSELNSLVFERFRDWVISSMEEETNSCEENQRNPRYFNALGELHQGQGNYEKAEPLLKKSYSLTVERFGESDPETLTLMNNLAGLYSDQGKYNEAEELYKRCLELRKQILGESHPDTLRSMNGLAALYYKLGRSAHTVELYEVSLDLCTQHLGDTHLDTLQAMNNLAALHKHQGKYDESEVLYERCLELKRQVFGESHPDTLSAMNNLAALYYNQRKYNESEEMYERCLELRTQLLGETHPDTLTPMNNLVTVYSKKGKYNEAEELCKRCLELRKQILGEFHPETVNSMNNLAIVFSQQGRLKEAEEICERVLELRKEILGESHSDTLQSMSNLANLYHDQGKYNEVEVLLKKCLELRIQVLKESHPFTLHTMHNLAGFYYGQERYNEAKELYERCLELRTQVLGDTHPDTLTSMNNLVTLRERQVKSNQADSSKNDSQECLPNTDNEKMETTVQLLVTVFGFDVLIAQRAVDSIEDKSDVQLAWNWILDHGGEDRGGPVIPTQICPHLVQQQFISPNLLENFHSLNKCFEGCPSDENWLCLSCGESRCGRYAHRHNLSHWKETGHQIALSLRDLSVWCYECDKYVKCFLLNPILHYAEHYQSLLGDSTILESKCSLPPPPPIARPNPEKICCVSYDPFTEKHRPSSNLPPIAQLENPERAKSIIHHLTECNLLDRCLSLPSTLIATDDIYHTHSREYISSLQSQSLQSIQNDIYLNEFSFEAAVRSAGCAISVGRHIVNGYANNGFALTRPPGHHARQSSTGGFCLLNNIAMTINDILYQPHNKKINRILVFDWDIHHGDGIQEIFYEDKKVLYISIHRHEHLPGLFYDSNGEITACGKGEGEGYNVNIPLPYREGGYGDIDYDYLLQQLVLPISKQYDPELVIIAAGYDACENDPVGGNKITPDWFGRTTNLFQSSLVSSSHEGRVMLVLEGGYNSFQTSRGVESCLRSLLEPRPVEFPAIEEFEVQEDIKQVVHQIKQIQQSYWGWNTSDEEGKYRSTDPN